MSTPPHRRSGSTGAKELRAALLLTSGVMVIEFVAALLSNSTALLADAGHMLTDVSALSLSFFAAWIAAKPITSQKTYGYYRTEILAALVNGIALWLLVIWIFARALARLQHPVEILTGPMLAAAVLGLLANLASSWILRRADTQSLNVRVARLHVLTDLLGSCGVILAGLLVYLKGWNNADAIAGMFIGVLITASSWVLVRQSVNILLEATPFHLQLEEVERAIRAVPGVRDAHDLHVWTITTGLEAMSGHLTVDRWTDGPAILERVNRTLQERFHIDHTTFQLELADSSGDAHAHSEA